jgi:glycosyltransferase involved in cell wall biosynthesis
MASMKTVIIPWKMPYYQTINGNHPLFSGIIGNAPKDIEFLFPDEDTALSKADMDHIASQVVMEGYNVGRRFSLAPDSQGQALQNYLAQYIETRDVTAQARIYAQKERAHLVFHHTAPLHLSQMSFILHFESLTTLFYPFLLHGYNKNVNLRSELIFHMVKSRLESDACKAIFTHIQSSIETICKSFASDIIASKVHYVPLGVEIPPELDAMIKEKLETTTDKAGLHIVFTNSAHGAGTSFLFRGGHDLLVAFSRHRESHPDSVLTIISTGRDAFEQVHPELMQGVEWIEQGIDDKELFLHLCQADVFALPAAGLHSYSVLRAMRCGAVLICSDAPGYEEYVSDQKTALVMTGRRDQVYHHDVETGWWRDDYASMHQFNPDIIEQLTDGLNRLATDREMRLDIANRALERVKSRHAIDPWVQSVFQLLRNA